jgi:tetratricopeptide (TPR) repeat protein
VGAGVSEEVTEAGPASQSNGAAVDPTAVALALDGASRERADSFLTKQEALIAAQLHHLHEQDKHLHLDMWEKRLGVWLRAATFCVGIAVAGALGLMVWDAAHSNGLIVEPFAVPEDMAAKGLTGQAIARQMLDKLYTIESRSGSSRSPKSYTSNWDHGIKVEIPETGVSIGEFRQFLRDWLGHDTHISGEIYHTDTGIAVTARTGGESGASFTGSPSDLDQLIQKAAEYIYGDTQPARYPYFLSSTGRDAEASVALHRMINDPSPFERANAWIGLNLYYRRRLDYKAGLWYLYKGISIYPDFAVAYHQIAWFERLLGHPEVALEKYRSAKARLNQSAASLFDSRYVRKYRLDTDLYIAFLLGDFSQAVALGESGENVANNLGTEVNFDTLRNAVAVSIGLQHEGIRARAYISEMTEPGGTQQRPGYALFIRDIARVRMDAALEDWPALAEAEASAEKRGLSFCPACELEKVFRVELRPWLALAKARTGDIASGEALIANSPGDCYDCVRIRGQIAEAAKQLGRADYWFSRAVNDAPSIPFAYTDWGQALLARGQPDQAVAQFKRANEKGPHFADPLEGWGEALMAKNQSHLALAKFAEANKYAPNWGRLHLKWGEALFYMGKKNEAKKQFARATQLDLTPSEKAELARHP